MLEIFYQVVESLGLDSLFKLGKSLVNLFNHLAGKLNFNYFVEVRDVFFENIFETNELLDIGILSLKVHVGLYGPVSPRLILR